MRELKVGSVFLLFSLFIIYESLRLGLGTLKKPGSGFLTFCAAVLLSVFSIALISRGWRLRESAKPFPRKVILALGILILYSLFMDILGFILSTFLMVGILFRLAQERPWWTVAGMSALVTFLAYLVFGVLLRVYFPRGFVGM
jgi:putative tricarboxylic transport membrane protein